MTRRWPGDNNCLASNISAEPLEFLRFVEELKKPVLEVLEEGVNNESSPLFKLGRIWGSGIIRDKIMEELARYWKEVAHGRTLEEVARYADKHFMITYFCQRHLRVQK